MHSAPQAYVFYSPKYCSAVRANLSLSAVILKHLLNPVWGKNTSKAYFVHYNITRSGPPVLSHTFILRGHDPFGQRRENAHDKWHPWDEVGGKKDGGVDG